jgi:hypothetical protein
LFRDTNKSLVTGLLQRIVEQCLIIFEGAHFLELLLHSAPSFESEFKDLREFSLGHLAVREKNLDGASFQT